MHLQYSWLSAPPAEAKACGCAPGEPVTERVPSTAIVDATRDKAKAETDAAARPERRILQRV